jgi:hypothetical protein
LQSLPRQQQPAPAGQLLPHPKLQFCQKKRQLLPLFRRKKENPSASGCHVSIATHFFLLLLMMILPLPAPESIFDCLQSNVDSKEF